MDTFFAPENLLFSVALLVMIGLAIIETLAVLLGGGASQFFDSFFHHELHVDVDGHAPGVLSWLHVGRVPLLVLLIIFLTAFGLSGLTIQFFLKSIFGSPMHGSLASIPAFVIALPTLRIVGSLFARFAPKDETTAVSQDSLVDRIATILIGTAARGAPAQSRVKDQFGQEHLVMVEPDIDGEQFPTGTDVLLVSRSNATYRAIRRATTALTDH